MQINRVQNNYSNNNMAFGKIILAKEIIPEYGKFLESHLSSKIKNGEAESAKKYLAECKQAFTEPLSLRLVPHKRKENLYVPECTKDKSYVEYDLKRAEIYNKEVISELGNQANDLDIYILPHADKYDNSWGALYIDAPALKWKEHKIDNISGHDITFINSQDGKTMGVPTLSGIESIKNHINRYFYDITEDKAKRQAIQENLENVTSEVKEFISNLLKNCP